MVGEAAADSRGAGEESAVRLPENLDDAQLRAHLDAIDIMELPEYIESLEPEDQRRVSQLLANTPQLSAAEIDDLVADLQREQWQHEQPQLPPDAGTPAAQQAEFPLYLDDYENALDGQYSFRIVGRGMEIWTASERVTILDPAPAAYLAGEEGFITFDRGAYKTSTPTGDADDGVWATTEDEDEDEQSEQSYSDHDDDEQTDSSQFGGEWIDDADWFGEAGGSVVEHPRVPPPPVEQPPVEHPPVPEPAAQQAAPPDGLLLDREGRPLDGEYSFRVDQKHWIALIRDGQTAAVIDNKYEFDPSTAGVFQVNQGVLGPYTKVERSDILNDDGKRALIGRNRSALEELFDGCAIGEDRDLTVRQNGSLIALGDDLEFAVIRALGDPVVGKITFHRRRIGANDIRISSELDRLAVTGHLKVLLMGARYKFGDPNGIKII